jgi:UDPglucose--hexose-1-phosphate uridylyltransferase
MKPKKNSRGQQEAASKTTLPEYDPSCYLCPGSKRAQGAANPKYENTFVFVNDYSAVREQQADYSPPADAKAEQDLSSQLLRADAVKGKCYVLTFSAAHNLTLADMAPDQILPVIEAWTQIYAAHVSPKSPLAQAVSKLNLKKPLGFEAFASPKDQYRYMQIFENKGDAMGCSNPHPHGQVWTLTGMPEEPGIELVHLQNYRKEHGGSHLLEDYVKLEISKKQRVVFENDAFLVVCPWWATWPFETMIISKTHKRALVDFSDPDRLLLAQAIAQLTRTYDNLFETHFPYSMGLHQAPLEGSVEEMESSYFHMHFYPPLLRSANVRKFLVG